MHESIAIISRVILMKRITFVLIIITTLCVVVFTATAAPNSGQGAAPAFVTEIPAGYHDWKHISVAHEEGNLNSFAAVLGNEIAIKAYRKGRLPFPMPQSSPLCITASSRPRKTTEFWPRSIFCCRSSHECPVHDQGFKEICFDGRMGVRSF